MKGLEALKHLYNEYILTEYPDSILKDIDKDKEIIEKELKALEIIKKNIGFRNLVMEFDYLIDGEEYDLLKEVLL